MRRLKALLKPFMAEPSEPNPGKPKEMASITEMQEFAERAKKRTA